MPKSSPYAESTVAELEKKVQELDEEIAAIKAQKRELAEVLDGKRAEEDAAKLLETMSDPQKAALMQAIKAEGIKPTSAVGTPGGN